MDRLLGGSLMGVRANMVLEWIGPVLIAAGTMLPGPRR